MQESILNSLLTSGPIAAVLFFFLLKLWTKLNQKDEHIAKLYDELRELERGNVETMIKLTAAIESLSELIKTVLKK